MVRKICCTTLARHAPEHTICLVNDILLVGLWFYKIKDQSRYIKYNIISYNYS